MNISIVGDSFGCGEWSYKSPGDYSLVLSHKGCQQYLIDKGHHVENYAEGGASMDDILNQIVFNKIKRQTVIVFATDPLRNQIVQPFLAQHSIFDLHRLLFSRWIKNLVKITQQQKCNIVLIGGHANLYPFDPVANVQVCTTSWLSDIVGDTIGNLSGLDTSTIEILNNLNGKKTNAVKQHIVDAITQKTNRLMLLKKHRKNFPDLMHPNKKCHFELAQKIIAMIG